MKEKKNFLKSKLFLFAILPVLGIAMVAAGTWAVHSFTIQSDVMEPFEIQYSLIGDAGNWNGQDNCVDLASSEWATIPNEYVDDVDGLYPGEGRKLCIKVNNLGEGEIDYQVIQTIENTNTVIKDKCIAAFGENTLSGTAVGSNTAGNWVAESSPSGVTINGKGIVVDDGAEPIDDCKIKIKVVRG